MRLRHLQISLLYLAAAALSNADKLNSLQSPDSRYRNRLIFSPTLQRGIESLRRRDFSTARRSKMLSVEAPAATAQRSLISLPVDDAVTTATAGIRSEQTRARVAAYLRALRSRFEPPAVPERSAGEDQRQGRSRQAAEETAPRDEPTNGDRLKSGKTTGTEGEDREDRGILFFPGNVIHSFGIKPSTTGECFC